jgi:tetratricopeptide (TPR) repeat protein
MRQILIYISLFFLLTNCKESCDKLYDKGLKAQELSDFDLAIEYFSKAIKNDCYDYDIFMERGLSYRHINQLDLALEDYYNALIIDTISPVVYTNIGVVFELKRDFDIALEYFKKSVQIDSSYALGFYNLGQHYFYSGDYELAVSSFLEAEYLSDSININIPIKVSMCYDSMYNDTMAVRYLKEYANLVNEAVVYYDLANRQLNLNMSDSAIKHLHMALKLDSNVHIYNLLGLAYDRNGQLDKAVNYYYKALEYGEKQSMITYNMSYVLEELDRLEEAINLIVKCNCYDDRNDFDLEQRKAQLEDRLKTRHNNASKAIG